MLKLEPYINFTDPVKMRLIFINPYSEESLKISYDMKTFLTVISDPHSNDGEDCSYRFTHWRNSRSDGNR